MEREICFFVNREIPIDENSLSNQISERGILHRSNPEDLGAKVFVHDSSKYSEEGQTIFVSRYLPRNKKFSLRPPSLCGERLILDRHVI